MGSGLEVETSSSLLRDATEPTTSLHGKGSTKSNGRSEVAKTLWRDPRYKEKTLAGIRRKKDDPNFIQTMREIGQRRTPVMQGKGHKEETIDKIRKSTQENWNKQHGIDHNDPLAKRNALIAEWQRLSKLLEHSPSSKEITKLKHQGETRFSTTMYKQEFGEGSFTRAKETLATITKEQVIAKIPRPRPTLQELTLAWMKDPRSNIP